MERLNQLCGIAIGLIVVTICGACNQTTHSTPPKPERTQTQADIAAEYTDPIKTFRTFLEATKLNDRNAAIACWYIVGGNESGALDGVVGIWVAFHRLNDAVRKLEDDGSQFIRDDCTDEALGRTLARLANSSFKIDGDTAVLTIKWAEDDGYPNDAFFYGEPIHFRRIGAAWKIDANAMCGGGIDTSTPGSWVLAFKRQEMMLDNIATEIEAEKLKTADQVAKAIEARLSQLVKDYCEQKHGQKAANKTVNPSGG